MVASTIHLGQRGTMVIPAPIRKALNIEEGSLLILEVQGSNLVVRPARAVPVEKYTDHRKAEFILNNAVDAADYARARKLVQEMGLDPDQIPHDRPG
jgi:AbrB family looped-hinge helix DNA binding protein